MVSSIFPISIIHKSIASEQTLFDKWVPISHSSASTTTLSAVDLAGRNCIFLWLETRLEILSVELTEWYNLHRHISDGRTVSYESGVIKQMYIYITNTVLMLECP